MDVKVKLDHPALEQGAMVDHFRVMRQLGAGGMGEVYLARDTKLGRKVALKIISANRIGTASAVGSFLAEAQLTARFSHPHIVTIYAVGEHGGCPYLALEYLEGETLRGRMRNDPPGVKESLRIGLAIAEALAEAHRMQILHRDLKPENVLIPRDGRLRVVDFGIAKALTPDEASARTMETMVNLEVNGSETMGDGPDLCGTPSYIAPELWREQEATPAVDVWALGVILYELLVCRHPFETKDDAPFLPSLLGAVLSSDPVSIGDVDRAKAPALAELIERCLEKDCGRRPTAADVVDRVGRMLSRGERLVMPKDSPFRGLQPFTEQHAAFFFGREEETAAFLERMRVDPVLPVLGPSGAGKSSFVQAGVIPMLREQGRWFVLRLRPGPRPFVALAARILQGDAVSQPLDGVPTTAEPRRSREQPADQGSEVERLAGQLLEHPEQLFIRLQSLAEQGGCRVLLFVDQLEELYTLVEDEGVRQRFMRAVCGAADDAADPVRVVFTLRDDFLGRVAEGVEARNALSRVTVVRTPGPEGLTTALTRTVEAAGFAFDQPDLVERMVDEVQGEPACLALLQFAARTLWERRDDRRRLLLAAVYEGMGGVAGALAEHADGVLAGLSTGQVRVARDLMLRLVTAEQTRRVLPRADAVEGLGPEAEEVLGRLVQARLVTVRRPRGDESAEAELELVHESLIHSWGRLSRWVDESREDRAVLAELGQAAELWGKRGRRDEEVWYGDALREAVRSVERVTVPVPEIVLAFLEAGKRREVRRRRARRALVVVGAVSLVIVAVVSVIVAMVVAEKSRQVRIQRDHVRRRWAEAQREGARAALGRGDLLEATAKLRGSLEAQDTPHGRALWWQVGEDPLVWQKRLGAVVYDVAFSSDGARLAVASQDHSVYLFDAATARTRVLRGHTDQVISVAVSPDGRWVASGGISGLVRLADLRTKTVRHLTGASAVVRRLAFNPAGTRLAAAVWDGSVRVWDLSSTSGPLVLRGHEGKVSGVVWTADGARLVSAGLDRTIRVWDATRGAEVAVLRGHEDGIFSLAITRDGRRVASGSGDRTIRIWRLGSDDGPRVLRGHTGGVTGVAFACGGGCVVSGSLDRSVRIWDAAGRGRVLGRHDDGVNSLAPSPNDARVASVGADRTIRIWRTDTAPIGAPLEASPAGVLGLAVSPDGKTIAAGYLDATVRLWAANGALSSVLRGHGARVFAVAFSRDGKTLASASLDKTIRLWDPGGGMETRVLEGHTDGVRHVAFSPNGRLLASGSTDQTVRLWDVAAGRQRHLLTGHGLGVYSVQFSPDGRALATASGDRTIRLWSVATGQQLQILSGHTDGVSSVAFSPDGQRLASGGWDRTVRLWDLRTRASRVIGRHEGRVYWLDFDPGGERVGAPGSDGVARIWSLETGVATVLRGHRSEVNSLRFSPDGKLAATAGDDGTVRLWDVSTGRPVWRAPLLYTPTLQLLTHRGWLALAGKHDAPDTRWRRAVEQSGVSGTANAAGDLLCVRTHDGRLEMWDLGRDERLLAEAIPDLQSVLARQDGCVSLARGAVRLYSRSASFREIADGVVAVAGDGDGLLLATDKEVLSFDRKGDPTGKLSADVGISALLGRADVVIVGFKEGTLEVIQRRGGSRTSLPLREVTSSPVVKLHEGPTPGTVVVGFANGLLGLWEGGNGNRLFAVNLHGAPEHVVLHKGKLYAASELGDHRVLDLSAFLVDYCELVRRVWEEVPVVWEGGQPVRTPPPPAHRCRK